MVVLEGGNQQSVGSRWCSTKDCLRSVFWVASYVRCTEGVNDERGEPNDESVGSTDPQNVLIQDATPLLGFMAITRGHCDEIAPQVSTNLFGCREKTHRGGHAPAKFQPNRTCNK